jgi:hypothetical protein
MVRALNSAGIGDPSAGVALALAPVVIKASVRSISIVTRKAKLAAGKGRVTTIRLTCGGAARCVGTLTVTKASASTASAAPPRAAGRVTRSPVASPRTSRSP